MILIIIIIVIIIKLIINIIFNNRCAGEIAAVPNTYCAVGVAYGAKVSGNESLKLHLKFSKEGDFFSRSSCLFLYFLYKV